MSEEIPAAVLTCLEHVKASGVTSMYSRQVVIQEMLDMPDDDARDASLWLHDNPDRYLEALKAMGKRR